MERTAVGGGAVEADVARRASPWRDLADDRLWAATAGALILLQLLLVIRHEPWLDEWQALLIAVQSPNMPALLANLRYEGHPPLWYLLLRGAAAIASPLAALRIVQLPIAMAIQALILFASPFPRWHRLAIASGAFVLIDYGAIARSLGLGVLLTLIAMAARRRRGGWIAIALMPATDMLFGVLSLGFVADRLRADRLRGERSVVAGVVAWLAVAMLSALSVRPAADIKPAFESHGVVADLLLTLWRLGSLLVPLQMRAGQLEWNQPLLPIIGMPAGLLFLWGGWRLVVGDRIARALFLGFAAFVVGFSASTYPLAIRHLSLLGWLVVLLRWRAVEGGAAPSTPFAAWIAVGSACGLAAAAATLARPFDTAGTVAAAIERRALVGARWIVFPDSIGEGVSALTGVPFERLGSGCTQTMVRWNSRPDFHSVAELQSAVAGVLRRQGRSYVLSIYDLRRVLAPFAARPLLRVPAGYDGQPFYVYELAADRPASGPAAPPCVAGLRPLPGWGG